jgi:hydrogenase small subunit
MSLKLLWIHCGGCGGDTWSFFNAESPNVTELFSSLDVELLWHPSISISSPNHLKTINEDLLSGVRELDVLCVEGSILRGPGGTGRYDEILGKPKKDLVASLANRARYILAIGTCASYGGIGANTEIEATGMQFLREQKGGFLGEEFTSGSGMPVINLPGCPCHCDVVAGTLVAIGSGAQLELDEYNTPVCGRAKIWRKRLHVFLFGMSRSPGSRSVQQIIVEQSVVQDKGGCSLFWLHAARLSATVSVFSNQKYRGDSH